MARDLATLKDKLWEVFEQAVERQEKYEDTKYAANGTPTNFAIAGRASIGTLGQAIAAVESAQLAQEAAARKFPSPIDKPTR